MYTSIYIHIYIYLRKFIHIYTYTPVYTLTYTSIYIYMYIYIHVHIYICIYTTIPVYWRCVCTGFFKSLRCSRPHISQDRAGGLRMHTHTPPHTQAKEHTHALTHALANLLGVAVNPRTFFFCTQTHTREKIAMAVLLSLLLWVLCHFTEFARLVWGRVPSFLIRSDLCIVYVYARMLSTVHFLSSHFQTVGMALPLILNKYMGLLVAGTIS